MDELKGGYVNILIEKAEGVNTNSELHPDGYVYASVCGRIAKTKVIPESINPEWNQVLQIKVKDRRKAKLFLAIYDYDMFGRHTAISYDVLSLDKLKLMAETSHKLQMCPASKPVHKEDSDSAVEDTDTPTPKLFFRVLVSETANFELADSMIASVLDKQRGLIQSVITRTSTVLAAEERARKHLADAEKEGGQELIDECTILLESAEEDRRLMLLQARDVWIELCGSANKENWEEHYDMLVPLWEYVNYKLDDHCYQVDFDKFGFEKDGYEFNGQVALLPSTSKEDETAELVESYHTGWSDTKYSSTALTRCDSNADQLKETEQEMILASFVGGKLEERGPIGNVLQHPTEGTVPLHCSFIREVHDTVLSCTAGGDDQVHSSSASLGHVFPTINLLALREYENKVEGDHCFTSDAREFGENGIGGYAYVSNHGCLFPNGGDGLVPLCRYFNKKTKKHIFSNEVLEKYEWKASSDITFEYVVGFIIAKPVCECFKLVPLCCTEEGSLVVGSGERKILGYILSA